MCCFAALTLVGFFLFVFFLYWLLASIFGGPISVPTKPWPLPGGVSRWAHHNLDHSPSLLKLLPQKVPSSSFLSHWCSPGSPSGATESTGIPLNLDISYLTCNLTWLGFLHGQRAWLEKIPNTWLSWNLLWRPGWPQTQRDPPASASWVLELKACVTTAGYSETFKASFRPVEHQIGISFISTSPFSVCPCLT